MNKNTLKEFLGSCLSSVGWIAKVLLKRIKQAK